jgi:hypothetical protein
MPVLRGSCRPKKRVNSPNQPPENEGELTCYRGLAASNFGGLIAYPRWRMGSVLSHCETLQPVDRIRMAVRVARALAARSRSHQLNEEGPQRRVLPTRLLSTSRLRPIARPLVARSGNDYAIEDGPRGAGLHGLTHQSSWPSNSVHLLDSPRKSWEASLEPHPDTSQARFVTMFPDQPKSFVHSTLLRQIWVGFLGGVQRPPLPAILTPWQSAEASLKPHRETSETGL